MKTTALYRTQATDTITVSTVHVRDGGAQWYETALIIAGRVSDPQRTGRKFQAGIEHDEAVACVRGYRDPSSRRRAFYLSAIAELQA